MLVELGAVQIARHWAVIKYSVERAVPPLVKIHPDLTNRILQMLLSGQMTCWVGGTSLGIGVSADVVMITLPLEDPVSQSKSLLIYSLFGFQAMDSETWKDNFEQLTKWAKGAGFESITAYTNVDAVLAQSARLGWQTSTHLISYDLTGFTR